MSILICLLEDFRSEQEIVHGCFARAGISAVNELSKALKKIGRNCTEARNSSTTVYDKKNEGANRSRSLMGN
jgi:hypothetical protein